MSWVLIVSLAALVLLNRYLLLEPRIKLNIPHIIDQMLQYSAPCLLTAIIAPMIFFDDDSLRFWPMNAYFLTACICVMLAILFRSIVLNFILSLGCFYSIYYLLGG